MGQVGSGAWSEEGSRGANPRRAATALARETDQRANGLDGGIKAPEQVELIGTSDPGAWARGDREARRRTAERSCTSRVEREPIADGGTRRLRSETSREEERRGSGGNRR